MNDKQKKDLRDVLRIGRDMAKAEGAKLINIGVDGAKEAREAYVYADAKFEELDAAIVGGVTPPERFDQNMRLIRGELALKVGAIVNETRKKEVAGFFDGLFKMATGLLFGVGKAFGLPL
jgi:hypothetical protein